MYDKNHFDQKDTGAKYLTAAFFAISLGVVTLAYSIENDCFDGGSATPEPALNHGFKLSN